MSPFTVISNVPNAECESWAWLGVGSQPEHVWCGVAWRLSMPVPKWLMFRCEIPFFFFSKLGAALSFLTQKTLHLVCGVLEEQESFAVLCCACGRHTAGSLIKALLAFRCLRRVGKSLLLLRVFSPFFFLYTQLC